MAIWYKTGTVSVTNGSPTVTGSGTTFTVSVAAGDMFTADGDKVYEVLSVTSNTVLTLAQNYTGATASGVTYALARMSTVSLSTVDLANQVSSLLTSWQVRENEYKAWTGGNALDGYRSDGSPASPAGSDALAGYYPLTDLTGQVTYVACPARFASPYNVSLTGTTTAESLSVSGSITSTGLSVSGSFTATGNTTLGDAAGDITTVPDLKALQVTTPSRASIRPSLLLDFANSKVLDPRITFTRASTTTYYDGKTVAKAEENLLTYSKGFDNAAWAKTTTTVTANSLAAPDGTTTADTLTATGANATTLYSFTATANPYVFSIYLYRKTGTGNVDITVDGTTWVTQTLTAGWTRFNTTLTTAAGTKTCGVRIAISGDEVYTWGAQLEQRSSVTAYTPTTTAPITNYIPVLQTAASGVARFDHNPVTGESLGLLIEEQRTNLLTYSGQFDNAAWMKYQATISANTVIAPDGTLTGGKLVENTTSSVEHYMEQTIATTTNQSYTQSVYVKAGETAGFSITVIASGSSQEMSYGSFTVSNGIITAGSSNGLISSIAAVSVGNGWYRCYVTYTLNGTVTSHRMRIYPRQSGVYTGDGYSGIYIWGAQLEAGAFPTSYIPTTSAQVTRAADVASMTGTNFSSWFRQDEGTFVAEACRTYNVYDSNNGAIAQIDSGSSLGLGSRFLITSTTYNRLQFYTEPSNASIYSAVSSLAVFNKISASYGYGSIYSEVNGGSVSTVPMSVPPPGLTRLTIGGINTGYQLDGTIKKLAYYPKRLTNAELQGLTAP